MKNISKKISIAATIAISAVIVVSLVFLCKYYKKDSDKNTPSPAVAAPDKKSDSLADEAMKNVEYPTEPQPGEATAPEDDKYKLIISDNFKNFGGDFSYSLHMYGSGYRAANESKPMKSASVIKLFIMEYAYSLMEKGEIGDDTLISGGKLSSHLESMITVSDNNATNILIDYFTMDKLNEYFASQGYSDTVLQRRMLDTDAAARGEENYTSARDVMSFLDRLYENKENYPQKDMLDIMKRQRIATKLRRDMPSGVAMASKTGELSDTENDVAIVFSPGGDYAIVCLTGNGSANEARNAMAISCRAIYDELQKSITQ